MTPDELREMQKHGTPIGSHGMTHRALTRISQAEMAAELADSRKRSRTCWTNALTSSRWHGAGNADVYNTALASACADISQCSCPSERHSRVPRRPHRSLAYRLAAGVSTRSAAAYQWMPWAMAAKRRLVSVLRQFLPTTSGR